MHKYLQPGKYVNSDHEEVIAFAHDVVGSATKPKEKIIRLYYAIRDQIEYNPYIDFVAPANFTAIGALQTRQGWCVSKSALLVACSRVIGVPARCGYADVINHLTTKRMQTAMGGEKVFYWHSYGEIYLDNTWIKATPAFNKAMCDKAKIKPLEFDGTSDSLFHEFDQEGNKHMEYLKDRGGFADVPFNQIVATFHDKYGDALIGQGNSETFKNEVSVDMVLPD